MSTSEEFRAERGIGVRARFGNVVDEIRCDGYLGAGVAELGEGGMEEAVLFVEGEDVGVGVGFFGLECHYNELAWGLLEKKIRSERWKQLGRSQGSRIREPKERGCCLLSASVISGIGEK